ncbi:MAG: hypothetical protein ABI596_09245 [Pyrinomonadaceae bacterium]
MRPGPTRYRAVVLTFRDVTVQNYGSTGQSGLVGSLNISRYNDSLSYACTMASPSAGDSAAGHSHIHGVNLYDNLRKVQYRKP